jgi:hypothetical protein
MQSTWVLILTVILPAAAMLSGCVSGPPKERETLELYLPPVKYAPGQEGLKR